MAIQRALLLIADIGGYTRFLKVHAINLAHAHDMVTQLLEAVIDGAASPLKLAKLEGDAAFFYAPLSEDSRVDVAPVVSAIRAAFERRKELLRIDRTCTCEGCTQVEPEASPHIRPKASRKTSCSQTSWAKRSMRGRNWASGILGRAW